MPILPTVMAITDSQRYGRAEMLVRMERAFQRGLRMLLIREPHLSPAALADFTHDILVLARPYSVLILMSRNLSLAQRLPMNNLHLSAQQLGWFTKRPAFFSVVGASCHTPEECDQAVAIDVDYIVFGSILKAKTPNTAPQYFSGLQTICQRHKTLVYGVGGLSLCQLATARACNAYGIAMIRGAWHESVSFPPEDAQTMREFPYANKEE